MGFGNNNFGLTSFGLGAQQLLWTTVSGAVSYNIYHSLEPGLSVRYSTIVSNTTELTFELSTFTTNLIHYFIVAAVGPNGEIGDQSNEISVLVSD